MATTTRGEIGPPPLGLALETKASIGGPPGIQPDCKVKDDAMAGASIVDILGDCNRNANPKADGIKEECDAGGDMASADKSSSQTDSNHSAKGGFSKEYIKHLEEETLSHFLKSSWAGEQYPH